MSAPIASNPGKAPLVAAESKSISLGTGQEVAPPPVTKEMLKGSTTESIPARPGAIPKGQGQKMVLSYVRDGDTATVKGSDGSDITCRMDTIDAPEIAKPQYGKRGQPYGEESKKTLDSLLKDKDLNVRVIKPDGKYKGRFICQIEVEGKAVDLEMVKQGAAHVYEYFVNRDSSERGPELRAAQLGARKEKKGVWSLPNPENPSNYR